MGSRRTTTRLSFGNGRSSNGDDVTGSRRSGGCSYLINVRPENRSTLCSVMAQLTEEKQPSFVTTLKSKAVSESCNVKFSCVVTGYPAPQVMWYKDDTQLDRFCGLPKYEIFHNGQNHSLHIYKCTVEDAAIYQASAINSKGIVSCSGVLEVGEMNEFKIHQRYFAKLKQKAENRRKEPEGKENQEPLRTISPDRTQRKRRSTMEAFLSTPSSMEDEGNEENHQSVALETEYRLQEATVKEVEKKTVQVTNGEMSITNGQTNNDNGSKSGTYIYDSVHKTFTAHHPSKSPFVKKKIKISNSTKIAKSDIMGEGVSSETRAKDETSNAVAPACKEATQTNGTSEEVMEIENDVSSLTLDSNFGDMKEEHEEPVEEESMVALKEDNTCIEVTESLQKENLTVSVPPVALSSPSDIKPGTEGKKAAKHEVKSDHKGTEEKLEICISSTKKKSSIKSTVLNISKKNIHTTEHVPTMEINGKSKASSGGCFTDSSNESGGTPCDIRTALLQRPCELAGNQLSEKETRLCQKMESVSRSAVPSEVTQAHTKTNRNDAPVNLKLPPDQCTTEPQLPQKTDDIQASSFCSGLQTPADKMAQETWENSRESNESHSVLLTHLHQSRLESPDGGKNTPGCNVSPATLQSHVDTAIKTVEGTEIQDTEKVAGNEVGKLFVQTDSVAPSEKIAETETKPAALHMNEAEAGNAKNNDSVALAMDATYIETMKNELISKVVENTSSELQKLNSETFETSAPPLTKLPKSIKSLEHNVDFNEITKPVTKVISIAELLRSQIKALEATQENPTSSIPHHVNITQVPNPSVTGACQEFGADNRECKLEVKTLKSDKEIKSTDNMPPMNIKATLMEIYQQLNKTEYEQTTTSDATSATVRDLCDPSVNPPLSLKDTGADVDLTELHQNARKDNEVVMEISQETEASTKISVTECSVEASHSGSKNVKHVFFTSTSDIEVTDSFQSVSNSPENAIRECGSPLTVTHAKASIQEENATISEEIKDEPVQDQEVGLIYKLIPEIKLNSKMERGNTESNMKTLHDQQKMEECNTNIFSLQKVDNHSSEGEFSIGTPKNNIPLIQQESSVVRESLKVDSCINSTPEPSPRLKNINDVSPIPSATPQELASGARRKILTLKAKPEETAEYTSPTDFQTLIKEVHGQSSKLSTSSLTLSMSPSLSRQSRLQQQAEEQTSSAERCVPPIARRKTTSETQEPGQQITEEIHNESKPAEKDKHDPFKAPQVIRKIRGEIFADASGHLKLWCQFFNILSDSTIKWYKDEEEIAQVKRNAGDETQLNLAIVQASCKDSGVYGCSITNQHGTDSTDLLLSADILAGMPLREDLGVGEEIEMTPLIFNKGLADSGVWGNKFFGRIMMTESHIGDGCSHKVWRAKVIYGLEPVFESGNTCIIKVRSPITYGGKEESCLIDRNLDMMKQECKIQNLAREYCKIFSAEARVIESFGSSLEVIPIYLMYRPANTIPYATVETDLTGVYKKYSILDRTGKIDMRTGSEVEQKCCALQHWIFQWTNGNLLLSQLEGVDTKITNVGISVKSTGHQGLSVEGDPKIFEQFVSQHKCNYFCGLLGLKSLKVMDSLMTPTKPKGSRSPLLQRKMTAGSSSPQTGRKAAGSPRVPRKSEQDGKKTPTKQKAMDPPKMAKTA